MESATKGAKAASRVDIACADGVTSNTSIESQPDGHSKVTSTARPRKRQGLRADSSYPRKRAVHACRTCRVRRTKCDNRKPSCTSCQDLGAECVYQQGDPSTFDTGTLSILERLDSLETLLRSNKPRETERLPLSEFRRQENDSDNYSQLPPLNPESPLLGTTIDVFPYNITVEGVLAWPVFSSEFEDHTDLKSLLQDHDRAFPLPAATLSVVDFEAFDGDRLVRNFFDNAHVFNPVLEEGKIHDYIREARFSGLGWDAKSCLLLLVYALGFILESFDNNHGTSSPVSEIPETFQKAEYCFLAAQKRMGVLLSRTGVVEAQCFFLAGVYLMSRLRPVEAWRMFVQAIACCQGFHTSKTTPGGQVGYEQKLQNSIYWTCFKSELELRLELQVSETSLRDFKYPAFFPSPPEGLSSQGETAWYFYLAEIALQRLKSRILYHIHQQTSGASLSNSTDLISNFEHQANEWLQSLPSSLSLTTTSTDPAKHDVLRLVLRGHLIDCYEVMYWPFIVDAVNGTSSRAGLADSFLRKGLRVCVERIEDNESGFYYRHHGTWLTMRSCTRSALVLLAARDTPDLWQFLPEQWEEKVQKVIALLSFWKDESRDAGDRLDVLNALMRQ